MSVGGTGVGGSILVKVVGQALAVSITLPSGRYPTVTVGGAAVVSMPYTISTDTTFVVADDNYVTVVATAGGNEVYRQTINVAGGNSWTCTPTDSYISGKAAYVANVGSTVTIPATKSYGVADLTLTADCTLTYPTPVAGGTFTLYLSQDQVGGHAITFPTTTWGTGVAPTLSTTVTTGNQNLLTANQSSVETNTTGLTSTAYAATTLARSTAQHNDGSASASLTADGTGVVGVTTSTGTSGVAVTAGQRYTAVASVKAGTTTGTFRVALNWYDSAGAALTPSVGPSAVSSASVWTQYTVSAVAPEGAAYAGVACYSTDTPAVSVVHYVDTLGIWLTAVAPYLSLTGSSGSFATSPDSAAFPTGDIDVRVKAALTDWTPSAASILCSKWSGSGGGESFNFYVNTDGKLIFVTSPDGTASVTATSSAAPTVVDGAILWVRVARNATTGVAKFYTSSDGSTWTQLGTSQTTTVGNIYDSTTAFAVGSRSTGAANNLTGKVYRVQVLDGTGDTCFDADFTRQEGEYFQESSRNAAWVTVFGRATWSVGGATTADPEVIEYRSDGTLWFGQRPVTIAGLDARYLLLTGPIVSVNSAPADGSLVAGQAALWFDSTNGAAKLMIKAKQADGTVKTGSVAVTT